MTAIALKERVDLHGICCLNPSENISLLTGINIEEINNYSTYSDIFTYKENISCTKLQRQKLDILLNIMIKSSKEKLNRYKVTNPWEIYKFYIEEMRYRRQEVFKVVLLNTKNEILEDIDVTEGTLNSSLVHPREIFRRAIAASSNKIILIHNHPSGSTNPSTSDKDTTKRLIECGKLLGIEVLDHIIIGDGNYFSFKESGVLK